MEHMRASKISKVSSFASSSSTTVDNSASQSSSAIPETTHDDSFTVCINAQVVSDSSEDESDADFNFTSADIKHIYNDWIKDQPKENVKMMAIMMMEYFRRCHEYMQAYRDGNSGGSEVEKAVKKYKSHRRVFGNID